jgi:DeoR family glycerol-3-phosphate regulon repressor
VRQAEIAELIAMQGKASVEELATRFDTSAETIRRDLGVLAEMGQVRKIHGGARAIEVREEGPFEERMKLNYAAKRKVAEKAIKLVAPRQTLFIDTGSTTLVCAEILSRIKDLTVITNSTRIAQMFAQGTGGSRVFLLGGQFSLDNSQTVGPATVSEIARYQVDHAILTVGALDARGIMDYSHDEAQVARAMIGSAAQVSVVVDHSKFGKTAPFRVCSLDQIDHLVVDVDPDETLGQVLASCSGEVI